MKTLLVLRHAKSSWSDSYLGDHDRPLNSRGKDDAPRMGDLLRAEDLVPEVIISSTAKRARDTAKRVADACGFEGKIQFTEDFYHASPDEYLQGTWSVPDKVDVLMIVGHNPGMEMLVELLTGVPERMTTANIAQISLDIQSWQELVESTQGELVNMWRPNDAGF